MPKRKQRRGFELTLMWPPTVNSYWTLIKRGRGVSKIISKKGKLYKQHVYEECVKQIGKKWKPLEGELLFTLEAYPPDRRKRDLDNLFKSLLDAMEDAFLFEDDVQISVISAERFEFDAEKKGIVYVTLEEIA